MVIAFVTENYRAWYKMTVNHSMFADGRKRAYEKQFICDPQKLFKLHRNSFKVNI